MACIDIKTVRTLKKALQDGKLSVDELLTKTGDERTDILLKYMDEKQSKNVSEFLIKRYRTELSDDVIDEIFSQTDKINKLREGLPPISLKQWEKQTNPPKWAVDYVGLNTKIENILNPTNELGFKDTLKLLGKEAKESIVGKETFPMKAVEVGKIGFELATSAVYKSIKASFDMSYALRQGFKVLTKSPGTWGKSFEDAWQVWKKIGSKEEMGKVMDLWKANYFSHPYYDALVTQGKLAFGAVEDFFPTTLVQKIPLAGNIFKASDEAFTMFSQSARFGLATEMIEKQLALKGLKGISGLTKKEIQDIAQFANSITGRGSLGKFEADSHIINKLLFSGRFIRSQVDTFYMPFNPNVSQFVRREAQKHTAITLTTIGGLMTVAGMFGEVGIDPRSSDFGKLKIGDNTRIDLTAGLGSYIVLATKQALSESKSPKTGKITELNSGKFGSQTRGDVLAQWATNKLAPAPGAINTLFLRGRDFKGDKPTAIGITTSLGVPISLENMFELMQDEEGAVIVAAWVADVLGMSSQTFKK